MSQIQRVLMLSSRGDEINLDVETLVEYDAAAEPTDSPIETGEPVTDHIIVLPFGLRVEGVVADETSNPALQPTGTDRHRVVYLRLLEALRRKEVFEVFADLRIFESMALVKVTTAQVPDEIGGLRLKLTFREIRIVSGKTATVKVKAKAKYGGARKSRVVAPKTSTAARTVTVNGILIGSLNSHGQVVPESIAEAAQSSL